MPPISGPRTPAEQELDARPWWINAGEWPAWLNVERVIAGYERKSGGRVRFVASLAIQTEDERWSPEPIAVFWQEKRTDPSHSHYFGIFARDGKPLITGAQSAADHKWLGGMHPVTGEIVFSRSCWDYRMPRDGSFSLDGGPGGSRWSGRFIPVHLRIIDGVFRVLEIVRPFVFMD